MYLCKTASYTAWNVDPQANVPSGAVGVELMRGLQARRSGTGTRRPVNKNNQLIPDLFNAHL